MREQLTTDRKALVAPDLKYKPIDPSNPPKGRCLFIDRAQGVAVIGEYRSAFGWTHYHPLPTLP